MEVWQRPIFEKNARKNNLEIRAMRQYEGELVSSDQ